MQKLQDFVFARTLNINGTNDYLGCPDNLHTLKCGKNLMFSTINIYFCYCCIVR